MNSLVEKMESLTFLVPGFWVASENSIFSAVLFLAILALVLGEGLWFFYFRGPKKMAPPAIPITPEEKQFQGLWAVVPVLVVVVLSWLPKEKASRVVSSATRHLTLSTQKADENIVKARLETSKSKIQVHE